MSAQAIQVGIVFQPEPVKFALAPATVQVVLAALVVAGK